MIYVEGELKEDETMRKFGISEYLTMPNRRTAFRELERVGVGLEAVKQEIIQHPRADR